MSSNLEKLLVELEKLQKQIAIEKAKEETNQTVPKQYAKKSKTGKRPKSDKPRAPKPQAFDDFTDSDIETFEPIKPTIENPIKKNIKKFNITQITQNPDELTRNALYQRVRSSGITHYNRQRLKKYPDGSTKYWKEVWESIVPDIGFQKIVELKKRQEQLDKLQAKTKSKKPTKLQKGIATEIKTLTTVKEGEKYSGFVSYQITFWISEDTKQKSFKIEVKNQTIKQIENRVDIEADEWLRSINVDGYKIVILVNDQIVMKENQGQYSLAPYSFDKMILKQVSFVKLPYDIQANKAIIHDHCVKDHLIEYSQLYRLTKHMNFIKNKDIWTVSDLKNLLSQSSQNFIITDQWLKTEWKHIGNHNKGAYNRFICANDHLYHVTSQEFNKSQKDKNKPVPVTAIKQLPAKIETKTLIQKASLKSIKTKLEKDEVTISSFVTDDILYTDKELVDAYNLYKKVGVKIELTDQFRLTTPFHIIAEEKGLYSTVNQTLSKPKPIYINCPTNANPKDIHVNDKNKAYTDALRSIKNIAVMDATTIVEDYDELDEIVDEYLYYVSTVLKGMFGDIIEPGKTYGGEQIRKFKDHIIITKVIKTKKDIPNPFRVLIDKMLNEESKTNPKTPITKNICNVFIGEVQPIESREPKTKYRINSIFTSDNELELTGHIKCGDVYLSLESYTTKKRYFKNMLPMVHQIFAYNNVDVINRIEKIDNVGNMKELVSIKTDSICYVGKKMDDLVDNIVGKWKYEIYKPNESLIGNLDQSNPIYNYNHYEIPIIEPIPGDDDPDYLDMYLDGNILMDGFGGFGKSYLILNELIPRLKKLDKKYCIICSQHQPLIQYIVAQHECYSLASYFYKFPNGSPFDTIIIDEGGLTGCKEWQQLWEAQKHDQNIILLGDRFQLPPVDGNGGNIIPLENKNIRFMFHGEIKLTKNYRNNYNNQDYIDMINGVYIPTEYELARHNVISKYNLCYTNEKRKELNAICTKDWTNKFCKFKVKVGGQLLCKDIHNKLRNKEITNNMILTIVSYDKDHIVVNNGHIDISLSCEEFKTSGIEHGYGLTLYCAQGRSIKYDEISFWETEKYKNHKGALYTAYSRIDDKKL